jgi:hypothetical protein
MQPPEYSPVTPAGVTITATRPDGTTLDVTLGVQVLYDLVIQSMDFGSGFLSVEEVDPIVGVAAFCGFKEFEAAERYVEQERVAQRQRNCAHPVRRRIPDPDRLGAIWSECVACGLRTLESVR